MKGTKEQKGITLVALIITIVILLILAIVAIGTVNESGIVGHAQDAGKNFNTAKKDEEGAIEGYEALINKSLKTTTGELERIYYVIDGQWAEGYVDSEGKIPAGATITAKLYKTNTPLQPAFPEEMGEISRLEAGYAYKLIIDGKGTMPLVADLESGKFCAWGMEINEIFSAEEIPESLSGLYLYITEAQINGEISNVSTGAFGMCISLANVNFNSNVTKINSYAFSNTNLASLNIENVTDIDPYAFTRAYGLKSITLPQYYTTVQEYAFSDSVIESIDLINVTEVKTSAFEGCSNLVNVRIGDNTTILGSRAFKDCDDLQSIDLKNVNSIGEWAFCKCSNLNTIKIKSSNLTVSGDKVFYDIAPGSKIYVLNQDVKDALEGKYDPSKTTVEIKTLAEMEQL